MFGCAVFTIAPFLTYFTLNTNVAGITVSYGILSASAFSIITVPSLLIPVTWFPEHKGKVIGLIASGTGFSTTVFTPLQTLLINPDNIPPITESSSTNSSSSYFYSEEVLGNIPAYLLYQGGMYALLLTVAILLTVEKPEDETIESDEKENLKLLDRLR